jgi:heat-inducible transcriptional repressor
MDRRSRDIFREIVQSYLDTGEPVGSRTISRRGVQLSPASIRNIMSDLAEMGLIDSPHTSAGRVPTHAGLRMFVDSLMQLGEPGEADKRTIESRLAGSGRRMENVLSEASELLSGLVGGAGLVSTPTADAPIRHIEFVRISSEQALAVIVAESGEVENRVLALPPACPRRR